MSEAGPEENGERRAVARLPIWWVVAGIAVALASTTLLILLLYEETRGPGEILREFARHVDAGDCAASYELLNEGVRQGFSEETWCTEILGSLDPQLDADFTLERAVLEGDVAIVEVSGVELTTWELTRFGERSWRVVGPEQGFDLAAIPD